MVDSPRLRNEIPIIDSNKLRGKIFLILQRDEMAHYQATAAEDFIESYSLFKEHYHFKDGRVYYPCSSIDVSPTVAFEGSDVIYVDTNEYTIQAISRIGEEAYAASALEYNPGKIDLLIMQSPVISPEVPASYLREEGFAICNDLHETASWFYDNDNYEFCGVIRRDSQHQLFFDDEDLDDFFQEVQTNEEFEQRGYSSAVVNYDRALGIVREFHGDTSRVLDEYKRILETELNRQRLRYSELLKDDPTLDDTVPDPDEQDFIEVRDSDNLPVYLGKHLPKKKGDVYNLFVFRKKIAA